ncbi:MAG: LysR family transcriptional regulator [Ruminococcaceae bacterium]|nr:LysR family transcriptional regulator [Oscillospiraceae bacterium]
MEDIFVRKELIYTIYQEKSISKAAQKLFVSQPSLSVMVKKIEDSIGLPLFDRSCKPLRLTEAGMEYIKATEQIRHIEASFSDYICAVNNLQAGSLGIGSNQLLSALVLPKYIMNFVKKYPNIRLDLLDADSTILEQNILSGRLDLILDTLEHNPDIFERQCLKSEELLLAVPTSFSSNAAMKDYQFSYNDILEKRHMDTDIPPVPLSEFKDEPFALLTRGNDTRIRAAAIFQEAAISPKVVLELDRLVTLYNFVEIGTAASIVSDTLVKKIKGDPDAVVFYKLPATHAKRNVYAFYKRNRYYSKAMEYFIESLGTLE